MVVCVVVVWWLVLMKGVVPAFFAASSQYNDTHACAYSRKKDLVDRILKALVKQEQWLESSQSCIWS